MEPTAGGAPGKAPDVTAGMELDTRVKLWIYETIARTAQVPTAHDVAAGLGIPPAEVEAAFRKLHQKRLLVPEPADPTRIRMAPPFSGVRTAFRVRVKDKIYDANCVWDGPGILAALHEDGLIEASDGHTGKPMRMEVRSGRLVPMACAVHFAVPAAQWWDDIVYT